MRTITFLIFVTCFLLLRPFQMQNPGLLFPGDDYSYFAYASSLSFGEFPSFHHEAVDEFKVPPLSRAGVGIMAAPFVTAFSMLDRLAGDSVVQSRTKENLIRSWSLFGAVFAAVFYFWLGCYFLHQGLELFFPKRWVTLSTALMVLTQGTALYVFRRPVFSHVYEFFLQSGFMFLLLRQYQRDVNLLWPKDRLTIFSLIGLSCFTLLVRQNGLPYALIFPMLIIFRVGQTHLKTENEFSLQSIRLYAVVLVSSFGAYFVIKYFPWFLNPELYAEANAAFENTGFMFQFESLYFYFKRFCSVIFGLDWGLLFTAPGLLLGMLALFSKRLPLRKVYIILTLPILLNLYIAIIWKSQGSWYGYRYVVYSAISVLLFPFTELLITLEKKSRKLFAAVLLWFAVPTFSMLLFEATPGTLLNGVLTEFGGMRVGNLTYQIEVWKVLLLQPVYALSALLKAGPAYLIFAANSLCGWPAKLPEKFHQLYPLGFDLRVFTQVLILYILPFGLLKFFPKKLEVSQK